MTSVFSNLRGAPNESQLAAIDAVVRQTPPSSAEQINRAALVYADPNATLPEQTAASLTIHNWRSAHQYPLSLFKSFLDWTLGEMEVTGLTVSRLKRVPTMIRKLERMNRRKRRAGPFTLWEMQDIGGVRAIVEWPYDAERLAARMREVPPFFRLLDESDYFTRPKSSGYRSLHLMYEYVTDPKDNPRYNGLKFELQIRTQLQHAWATSNEIVGTFRREDLKSGEGDPEWLRFFTLAGSAIARQEGLAPGKNVPEDDATFEAEFGAIKAKLHVRDRLNAYNVTQQAMKDPQAANGKYFVIRFDLPRLRLDLAPFTTGHFEAAMDNLRENERAALNNPEVEVAFVTVDSLAELEEAYPNYFADTEDFLVAILTPQELEAIATQDAWLAARKYPADEL